MTRQMDIAMGGPGASPEQVTAAAEDLLRGQGARGPRDAPAHPSPAGLRHRLPGLDVALQMLHDGWRVDEPFLRSVLRAVRMKLVHGLLTKCRIHEPQGALLKGVRVRVRVRVG